MSVKKIGSAWKRKQAKKIVKAVKVPMFRNRVMKDMDNVRGGPRFNLTNRAGARQMNSSVKEINCTKIRKNRILFSGKNVDDYIESALVNYHIDKKRVV